MTTTINFKLLFSGFIITSLIFLAYTSGAFNITAPQTLSNSITKSMVTPTTVKFIYRGVPVGSKAFDNAASGIASPVGGHSNPLQHRDGNNNSQFTSWTTDIMIAYNYATNNLYGRCNGIILMKKVDLSGSQFVDVNSLNGGDIFNESEILVKGMINGAIPILVKPGCDRNLLLEVIKKAL